MGTLTTPRHGVQLWHDADTDREALHKRYAAFCDEECYPSTSPMVMNSFSFEQSDGTWLHTIVVVFGGIPNAPPHVR